MTNNGIEQQKVSKALAREIKFESVMFADEFKHSTREPLRFILWLWELTLWLNEKVNNESFKGITIYEDDVVNYLITNIEHYQNIGILPKKEKK